MRHSQSEKLEIIRVVEDSALGVKRTLWELDINRSTFYAWYRRYQEQGVAALEDRTSRRRQFWNAIPPWVKKKVMETALEHLDKSPRELAWYLTDTQGYFISESSVYRILKVNDLITSPAYTVLSAYSEAKRTVIPREGGQPFRRNADSDSDGMRTPE